MQQTAHVIPYHHSLPASIVQQLCRQKTRDFSEIALVLPTQRLQQYIRFELSQHFRACCPPHLFTVADFARALPTFSPHRVISATEQMLVLHSLLKNSNQHYLRQGMENKLAQFFDELAEQNLVEGAFSQIKILLENDFFRDEAHLARLNEQTDELHTFYLRYREFLEQHQLIDERHALQQAFIGLERRSAEQDLKRFNHIWVAGFSDAQAIQILLFRYLQQHTGCRFYFHADPHFLSQNESAAQPDGHFVLLRRLLRELTFDLSATESEAVQPHSANATLLQHAFTAEVPEKRLPKSSITVHAANTLLFEVKAAAGLAHKLISAGDALPEEIILVAPDEARYSHLIRSVFAEAKIPMSDSMGLPLLRTQLGQWLHLIVDLLVSNWRVSDVVSLLANPLMQAWLTKYHPEVVPSKLQETISHYADSYRISSGLLYDLKLRSMQESDKAELAGNLLQQLQPIASLLRSFAADGSCTVGEWAQGLWRLVEAFDFEKLVQACAPESLYQEYAALKELYSQLQRIFRLDAILPEVIKLQDFYHHLLQNVFSSQIRLDGQAHSGVQIMGLLVARSLPCKVLIILGNNEGSFPASPHREHFYADPFRFKLGMMTHKKSEQLQDQQFYALVAGAGQVHLFYARRDDERPAVKSRYVQRFELLNRLQGGCVESTFESGQLFAGDFLAMAEGAHHNAAWQYLDEWIAEQARARTGARGKFAGDRVTIFKNMSPSTMEYLLYCPFQFLLYKLQFSELELPDEDMDNREVGEWLHRVCQHFFIGKNEKTNFSEPELNQHWHEPVTEQNFELALARLRKMSRELAQKDRSRLDMLYQMEFIGWKKFLEHEMQGEPADYAGSDYEFWLTEKENHILKIGPFPIQITGRVDRIARGESTVRVIDYKTRKSWSPAKVKAGMAPQLPLYVEMLKQQTSAQNLAWSAEYLALSNGEHKAFFDDAGKNELGESWQNLHDNVKKRLTSLSIDKQDLAPEEDKDNCKYCLYEGICRRQENWILGQTSP